MSDESTPRAEHRAVLEIKNRLGLHARAAVQLVDALKPFDAEVTVSKDGQSVNGRSIMGIMMLGAEQGSHIEVTATGAEAGEALEALRALIDARFNETG